MEFVARLSYFGRECVNFLSSKQADSILRSKLMRNDQHVIKSNLIFSMTVEDIVSLAKRARLAFGAVTQTIFL